MCSRGSRHGRTTSLQVALLLLETKTSDADAVVDVSEIKTQQPKPPRSAGAPVLIKEAGWAEQQQQAKKRSKRGPASASEVREQGSFGRPMSARKLMAQKVNG
jgi:hypothetical protein